MGIPRITTTIANNDVLVQLRSAVVSMAMVDIIYTIGTSGQKGTRHTLFKCGLA